MGQDLTWASAETSWTINPLLPTGNNLSEETEFLEIFLTNPLSLLSSLPPTCSPPVPWTVYWMRRISLRGLCEWLFFLPGRHYVLIFTHFPQRWRLWGLTRTTRFKIVVLPFLISFLQCINIWSSYNKIKEEASLGLQFSLDVHNF